MFDFLLVFFTFVVPGLFFSIVFFKVHQFKLCVVDMMFWGHFFIVLMPSIVFLFDETKDMSFRYYLAAAMGTLLLPLGALIGQTLIPLREGKRAEFRYAPLNTNPLTDGHTLKVMVGLLVICCISVTLLAISTSDFPLRALFTRSGVDVFKSLRNETGESSSIINDVVLWTLAPILFVSAVLYWRYAQTLGTKIFLIICMLVPFINNSYAGRKTPVATMFLLALFASLIASRRKSPLFHLSKRKVRLIVFFGTIICGYPIAIFMFLPAGANYDFFELIRIGLFERIFLRPAENTYAAFALFPEQYPFTRFFDIGKIATLFGDEPIRVSKLVSFSFRGTEANSPPTSVGVFYFQNGWPGVVIISVFVGMVLKISENILLNHVDKTVINVALYALLLNGAIRISWGQYHAVFLIEAIVPMFTLALTLAFLQRPAVIVPHRFKSRNV